ncbi:hypothetical protein PTTG_29169 [Puccinia triticina 1-1 BBBD Race 1]|uniref:Acetyl-CoA carboxylase central domain-containing protein n=1 Tax=Puccinia triticina (isolate 1-1 / race 1 (BBBD)) TaxID=630390 RepID=A0A180G5V7_PUCT1|nr:hypothetical protein PTTG_29169 [Puccinia triticina 1-1 BBBD Race 1]
MAEGSVAPDSIRFAEPPPTTQSGKAPTDHAPATANGAQVTLTFSGRTTSSISILFSRELQGFQRGENTVEYLQETSAPCWVDPREDQLWKFPSAWPPRSSNGSSSHDVAQGGRVIHVHGLLSSFFDVVQFVPGFVNPLVELCLSHQDDLRSNAIQLFEKESSSSLHRISQDLASASKPSSEEVPIPEGGATRYIPRMSDQWILSEVLNFSRLPSLSDSRVLLADLTDAARASEDQLLQSTTQTLIKALIGESPPSPLSSRKDQIAPVATSNERVNPLTTNTLEGATEATCMTPSVDGLEQQHRGQPPSGPKSRSPRCSTSPSTRLSLSTASGGATANICCKLLLPQDPAPSLPAKWTGPFRGLKYNFPAAAAGQPKQDRHSPLSGAQPRKTTCRRKTTNVRELVDSKYTGSYVIVNFEYEGGDANENEPVMVSWLFRIRKGASPPSTPRKGLTGCLSSTSDLTYVVKQLQDEPMRSGVMFSIKNLEDLDKFMPNVLMKFPDVQPKLLNPDPKGEPHHNVLNMKRRRNQELAFQLELSRLSNFHVTPCPTENRQIHIYYAKGKENLADSRFFVRTIVRPGRIKGLIKVIGFEELQAALAGFLEQHGKRLWRLRVTAAEVRLVIEDESGSPQAIRVMIDNLSGFVVQFEAYKELEQRTAIRQASRREWKRRSEEIPFLKPPTDPLVATELVQDEYGTPQEVSRPPGRNTVEMVAWIRMIVIANDITFKIGSFGPAEDDFFYRVTELAQKLGVPHFCAAWNELENPIKGFKFLYLTQDAVKRLKEKGEENLVTEEVAAGLTATTAPIPSLSSATVSIPVLPSIGDQSPISSMATIRTNAILNTEAVSMTSAGPLRSIAASISQSLNPFSLLLSYHQVAILLPSHRQGVIKTSSLHGEFARTSFDRALGMAGCSGGLQTILSLFNRYVDQIDSLSKEGNRTPAQNVLLVHLYGGLKVALDLLQTLCSSTALLESPHTVLLQSWKDLVDPPFDAPGLLISMRARILADIQRLWRADWLNTVVKILLDIIKADGKASPEPTPLPGILRALRWTSTRCTGRGKNVPAISVRLRMLALLANDSSFEAFEVTEIPKWLASSLLIVEAILAYAKDKPASEVELTKPAAEELDESDEDDDEDDRVDNPIPDSVAFLGLPALMNEPRQATANQTASTSAAKSTKTPELSSSAFNQPLEEDLELIFQICTNVLRCQQCGRHDFLAAFRVLLTLTQKHSVAEAFLNSGVPAILLRSFSFKTESRGCLPYAAMLLRDTVESNPVKQAIMTKEITHFISSHGRVRQSDLPSFCRHLVPMAWRDWSTLMETIAATCKLVPNSAATCGSWLIALNDKKDQPTQEPNKEASNSTLKIPSGETAGNEMQNDEIAPTDPEKPSDDAPWRPTVDGTMQFLMPDGHCLTAHL